jgi:hypothetical protein
MISKLVKTTITRKVHSLYFGNSIPTTYKILVSAYNDPDLRDFNISTKKFS